MMNVITLDSDAGTSVPPGVELRIDVVQESDDVALTEIQMLRVYQATCARHPIRTYTKVRRTDKNALTGTDVVVSSVNLDHTREVDN